ncbi:response regulator transcription factor [Clostridium tarantellae]|uniref:Stage 0 sporulation protein A homolog n=1 Tax=Clostridium tarantellae TaxID=39493 RepID=A0A6I1MFQ1_9CLOT|nr:response regulator transcription factor [Clostridium tarantellae]MPQ42175.1 response regulator [Clostridium tarantellae]
MANLIKKVLLIDNNKNLYKELKDNLQMSRFNINLINNFDIKVIEEELDLIIIDLDSSFINRINIIKLIRNKSDVPIIAVTTKDSIFDKVLILDMGADDYIVKPFDCRELFARIRAILRRYKHKENDIKNRISFEDLIIDAQSYKVIYKNKELTMAPKEFKLLYYIAINNNKVFTREKLLNEVWGDDYLGDSRTVDVHIKRLREKLGKENEWKIKTIWGIGYKFEFNNKKSIKGVK